MLIFIVCKACLICGAFIFWPILNLGPKTLQELACLNLCEEYGKFSPLLGFILIKQHWLIVSLLIHLEGGWFFDYFEFF